MKGVSPLIATVLLIASVIAVAGIISVWLTSFARTTTSSIDTMAANQTKCAGAYIKVDSVSSSLIYYSNPSAQPIGSISFVTSDGRVITPSSQSLSPAGLASTIWYRGTNTSVIAKGLCLSSIPIEGSCASSDSCCI
ncbi:MAG TPA: archaellin/type IV pilin N-terminal domain-containing protein [archaeon]|nr:archaellin/type IV pilin N-terminal domain-containing protein [archaeon]